MQDGQLVAYITINQFGNFVPMLAKAANIGSHEPDALLIPEAALSPFIQLEYALRATVSSVPSGTQVFGTPFIPSETGLTWLSDVQVANGIPSCRIRTVQTRKRAMPPKRKVQ